jgi:ribosomal protein L37AE/L43A
MSSQRKCPSCSTEKAQRISEIFRQSEGIKDKTVEGVPASYHPPKAPWAYVQGFLLGIPVNAVVMLSMTSPQGGESEVAMADLASSVAFIGVWVGYGALKSRNYTQKLNDWKDRIASKFLCRKCSHAFEG